jgi:hypothetical protein
MSERKKPEPQNAEEKLGDAIHLVTVVELAISSYAAQHSGNREEASSMCILLQRATALLLDAERDFFARNEAARAA